MKKILRKISVLAIVCLTMTSCSLFYESTVSVVYDVYVSINSASAILASTEGKNASAKIEATVNSLSSKVTKSWVTEVRNGKYGPADKEAEQYWESIQSDIEQCKSDCNAIISQLDKSLRDKFSYSYTVKLEKFDTSASTEVLESTDLVFSFNK